MTLLMKEKKAPKAKRTSQSNKIHLWQNLGPTYSYLIPSLFTMLWSFLASYHHYVHHVLLSSVFWAPKHERWLHFFPSNILSASKAYNGTNHRIIDSSSPRFPSILRLWKKKFFLNKQKYLIRTGHSENSPGLCHSTWHYSPCSPFSEWQLCGVLAAHLFSLTAITVRPVVIPVSTEVAKSLLNPFHWSRMNLINETRTFRRTSASSRFQWWEFLLWHSGNESD